MKRQEKSNCRMLSSTSPDSLLQAATVIRAGGIVAIPTETYYGLAVNPFNEEALQRLFKIKQRPSKKPVLVLVDNKNRLYDLISEFPISYQKLCKIFWPGPLTLIFPALPHLNPLLTGYTSTIGVRISSCQTATELCRVVDLPITATSANISGKTPASTAAEVMESLGSEIDMVIDGGRSKAKGASTIIAELNGKLHIKRQGILDLSLLK